MIKSRDKLLVSILVNDGETFNASAETLQENSSLAKIEDTPPDTALAKHCAVKTKANKRSDRRISIRGQIVAKQILRRSQDRGKAVDNGLSRS